MLFVESANVFRLRVYFGFPLELSPLEFHQTDGQTDRWTDGYRTDGYRSIAYTALA